MYDICKDVKNMSIVNDRKNFWNLMSIIPDGGKKRAAAADVYVTDECKEELFKIYRLLLKNKIDEAYEVVARAAINCLKEYNKVNGKKRETFITVPLTIRKAVYFIAYTRYAKQYGFDRNKKNIIKPKYQKETLEGINKKLQELNSKIIFHKNSFNNEKWNISPYQDFVNGVTYTPANVPINYNGKKSGILGFMISSLVEQVDYELFLDAFGGSGAALMSIPPLSNVKEYINDYDSANANFYRVLKDEKTYRKFIKKWNQMLAGFKDQDDSQRETLRKKLLEDYKKILEDYKKTLKKEDFKKLNRKSGDVECAIAFLYMTFMNNIRMKNKKKVERLLKIDVESDFRSYHKRLKNVGILNDDAVALLGSSKFNQEKTLCYLDSPYTATKGYNVGFDSGEMEKLLDKLSNFKGKFIFSCRAAIRKDKNLDRLNDEYEYNLDTEKYNKQIKKLEKQETMLADFFRIFKEKMCSEDKKLFVLYQSIHVVKIDDDDIDADTIKENIYKNRVFEIMITNFDFKCPDINHYLGSKILFSFGNDRTNGFRKSEFNEFCDYAINFLTDTW